MNLKPNMHARNLHNKAYDFDQLIESCHQLKPFVIETKHGFESIDFFNPQAVRMLNKALLKHFYQIDFWEIPEQFLCPPVPGRADYIHHLADLLATSNSGKIPKGKDKFILDLGVGASCIYPLLGERSYGWSFVGSDCETASLKSAQLIIEKNPVLENNIELRKQDNPKHIFKGIVQAKDRFVASICNPPFHASIEDAQAGSKRKTKNLTGKPKDKLNFGGKLNELCYPGGERAFIKLMIKESKAYSKQILWFTSLVSKASSLEFIYHQLKDLSNIKTIPMGQGNKQSRLVAWSFIKQTQHQAWLNH